MLLGQVLRHTRERTPDKVALHFGGRLWNYAALDDQTDRVAAGLAVAGVRPGYRVALLLPNCPELVLCYFGCFKLGAICVPLNYRYRQEEARYALEHSGATSLVVHQSLAAEVEHLPLAAMGVARRYLAGGSCPPTFTPFEDLLAGPAGPPDPDVDEGKPAAILYTSGSTARPKGVVYTQGTLWQNCLIQAETFAFTPDDVHLVSTAACHAAAFTGQLLPNVHVGGTAVLTHLPSPEEVVRQMAAHRVTRTQMLPASLEDLVEYLEEHPGADLRSWRCCTAGGDVVPAELHRRFRAVAGFDLTELYGMTEALSCITNPPFGPKRHGSVGRPAVRTEVRVVDAEGAALPDGKTGELLVRSPAMMVGYWNDPAATAEALRGGWVHTGDLARRDADGCFWFVGRKKEIVIRGGSNISPLEVEAAIDAHPAVHLSCVVGVPDAHFGQLVAAYVQLRHDAAVRPTPQELRQFVADRIAAYMVPERITVVDHLPLNATGKVDRRQMHARVLAEQGAVAS
jgi:acyl-CoA synthetase (AMP-forming)/AMP-acid ligase II